MKQLTLIRHAKSSWKVAGMEDAARPLNRRGKRDAVEMGQRLAAIGFKPDVMIASPAKRARSTAARLGKEIGYPKAEIVIEDGVYHATSERLLRIVSALDEAYEHVALVGHNPGFTELSSQLSRDFIGDLPTCSVVRLELAVSSWNAVRRKCGTLLDFDYPKRQPDAESL